MNVCRVKENMKMTHILSVLAGNKTISNLNVQKHQEQRSNKKNNKLTHISFIHIPG